MGFLRRLDDRVIGPAERDPAARRRATVWANALLLLVAGAIAVALWSSDHSGGVYVLIMVVVFGAVMRIVQSRGR